MDIYKQTLCIHTQTHADRLLFYACIMHACTHTHTTHTRRQTLDMNHLSNTDPKSHAVGTCIWFMAMPIRSLERDWHLWSANAMHNGQAPAAELLMSGHLPCASTSSHCYDKLLCQLGKHQLRWHLGYPGVFFLEHWLWGAGWLATGNTCLLFI